MHPQLYRVINDFKEAQRRLHAIAAATPDSRWSVRPNPKRWSIAECIAHVNLTSKTYLPLMREALEHGKRRGKHFSGKYRRDLVGWLLWKRAGPRVRRRRKTNPAFVPSGGFSPRSLVQEFDRLQDEHIRCVEDANGLHLNKILLRYPFNRLVQYNLYAGFTILAAHQHRHLWQAEQVLEKLKAGSSADS